MQDEVVSLKDLDSSFKYEVASKIGGEKIMRCFACGTCSASCPIRQLDERYNPRKIIRMIILGMKQQVLTDDFIWLCANCHACYERCPQDVRFTDIIHALRSLAIEYHARSSLKIISPAYLFADSFIDSIKKYGRVWETELLLNYFIKRRDLKGIFSLMPLALKMLFKGKINLLPSKIKEDKVIKALFKISGETK